jgi:LysM repeat protein
VPASAHRRRPSHYAAPAAFLAAVTIAVLLIRSGLGSGPATPAGTTIGTVTHPTTVSTKHHKHRKHKKRHATAARYYVVQSGDTFGSIASANGTTVARLEQLNPGVSTNALAVGQRIRVK